MIQMPENFSKFTMLFDLLQTAAIAVLGFVMWVRKPGEQALTENDAIDRRVARLEQAQRQAGEQAVTREELYQLRESFARLDARYESLQDSLSAQAAALHRIEDYLLQEGRK
jgi:Tfp pilus assembly protein PilO